MTKPEVRRFRSRPRFYWSFSESDRQHFRAGHLREREIEGEARFRAEILAHAVLVQCVAASACAGIVKGLAEVVAAEEPFETTARGAPPVFVAGERVGLECRGNH